MSIVEQTYTNPTSSALRTLAVVKRDGRHVPFTESRIRTGTVR